MWLWTHCQCYCITLSCVAPLMHCISAHQESQMKMSTKCFPFSSIWLYPSRFLPFIMSGNCLVILLSPLAQLFMVGRGFSWKTTSSLTATACIPFHLNLRVWVLGNSCRSPSLWKYIMAPRAVAAAQNHIKENTHPPSHALCPPIISMRICSWRYTLQWGLWLCVSGCGAEEEGCYLHGWTRTRWRKGNIFQKLKPGLGEIRRKRSIGLALWKRKLQQNHHKRLNTPRNLLSG